ncbi:hypothetical protein BT69DRAFT_872781 [Atractiella rhizophila]|nr:hypothetical protein BT69DRAFT_872781 [Atractiella rhizophila]
MDSALDLEHSDQASHFTAFSYSTLCLQYHLLTLFRIDCSTTRLRVLTSHKGLWKLMPSDGFDVVDGGRRRSGLEEEDGRSRSMLLLISHCMLLVAYIRAITRPYSSNLNLQLENRSRSETEVIHVSPNPLLHCHQRDRRLLPAHTKSVFLVCRSGDDAGSKQRGISRYWVVQ